MDSAMDLQMAMVVSRLISLSTAVQIAILLSCSRQGSHSTLLIRPTMTGGDAFWLAGSGDDGIKSTRHNRLSGTYPHSDRRPSVKLPLSERSITLHFFGVGHVLPKIRQRQPQFTLYHARARFAQSLSCLIESS